MEDSKTENSHHFRHNIETDIVICVKCGSSNVIIENEEITCKDCGSVEFYKVSDN